MDIGVCRLPRTKVPSDRMCLFLKEKDVIKSYLYTVNTSTNTVCCMIQQSLSSLVRFFVGVFMCVVCAAHRCVCVALLVPCF